MTDARREAPAPRIMPAYRTTLALSLLAAVNAFAIDVSTPVLPAAASVFGVDVGHMQMTVGLYMFGYGFGQIPAGLMADVFGRRITVLIAMLVYILAGIVATLSPDIDLLLAMRFLQGLCGAAGVVISRAVARDITTGAGTGRLLGLMTATLGVVMIVGPLLGAMLLAGFGWWAPFLSSAVFGAAALWLLLTSVGETMASRPEDNMRGRFIDGITAFRNSPHSRISALLMGLAFCILIAFVTLSSEVYIRHFAMDETGYAVIFAIASVGYILGGLACRRLVTRMSTLGLVRVIVAGFGAVGVASLFLLPVSDAHPAALTITMIGAFCGIGAMLSAAATLALEALPRNAGMASGIMGSFQILLGAVFSLVLALVDANSLFLLHFSVAGCAGLMGVTILATRRLAPLDNR